MAIKKFILADIFDYLDKIGLSLDFSTGGKYFPENFIVKRSNQQPKCYDLVFIQPNSENQIINILKPSFFLKTINKTEGRLNIQLFDYESGHSGREEID